MHIFGIKKSTLVVFKNMRHNTIHESSSRFKKRIIDIDSYEATIFPAEKVENTKRLPIKCILKNEGRTKKPRTGVESNGDVVNDDVTYR